MTFLGRLHLQYDEATGYVSLGIRQRRRGSHRGRSTTPLSKVHRDNLRALCDALHDLADDLDRKDRNA